MVATPDDSGSYCEQINEFTKCFEWALMREILTSSLHDDRRLYEQIECS